MQAINEHGRERADQEAVRQGTEERLGEQPARSDQDVLHACRERGRNRLPRPDVRWVGRRAVQEGALAVDYPADGAVVDGWEWGC